MPVLTPLPLYGAFTAFTPAIPKFYWDVYSQEERIKCLCGEITKIIAFADATAERVNINTEDIEELKVLFKKFQESGFDDYYRKQCETWIDNHLQYVMKTVVRQVFFGLTSTGRFCAYVPESWNDLQFDTGAVYGTENYGRLILRYRVNGEGIIDNTGGY